MKLLGCKNLRRFERIRTCISDEAHLQPPGRRIVVGEGGADCFVYLAERRVGPSRVLECHGLDLQSDTPEGNALLAGFVRYLAGIKRDGRRGQDKEE